MRQFVCAALALGVLLFFSVASARAADPSLLIEHQLNEKVEIVVEGGTVRFPKEGSHTVKGGKNPLTIGNFPKAKYDVTLKVGDVKIPLKIDLQDNVTLLIEKRNRKIVIESNGKEVFKES